MSASLVGSEMCIRDRDSPRGRTHAVISAPSTSSGRTVRASHGSAPFGAVSYTHLTLPTICSV
eukprot:9920056-Alexandrium_andersonii.AAC.1